MLAAPRLSGHTCRIAVAVVIATAVLGLGAARGADADALSARWEQLRAEDAAALAPKLAREAQASLAALAKSPADAALQARAEKQLDLLAVAMRRTRTAWPELLALRSETRDAGAPRLDARNWQAAENIFGAAAQKLETERVDAARAQALEATPLYERARWTAWRANAMQGTDSLIQRLDALGARQYVPRSFVRAVDAREAADQLLTSRGRPDTEVQAAGARAASEARHALYLLERVRGVCDKQATDRLENSVLEWEEATGRTLRSLGLEASFEQGLAAPLGAIEKEAVRLRRERDALRTGTSQQAGAADSLRSQADALRDTLYDRELQIAALRRVAQEQETMARIQQLVGRDEGRVLLDNRDVILRLHGLQFASGQAELPPAATPLLAKVVQIAKLLPGSRVVVEGHTDAQGKPDTNLQLSQQRAAAVRTWLAQNSGVEPAQITSLGFGASRPVATNDTEEGRALNRRIEIILARPQ